MPNSTDLAHVGRNPAEHHGMVNTPVYRGSTVLFPTLEAMEGASQSPFEGVVYGRYGTPTHRALQDAMTQLEGAHGTALVGCGLAAMTTSLLALLQAGDHVLFVDSVFAPTRWFADGVLKRMGVESSYFGPGVADLGPYLQPATRVVVLESPGSLSFEVLDLPALAAQAHAHGAHVVFDNTWATPLFCNPLRLGADVVVHAATKYLVGHADVMLGTISCNERTWVSVRNTAASLGQYTSPDDCFLVLRGLRTLDVRLRQHQQTALRLAAWLAPRPEVAAVLHPALPGCPGHALWKRDFSGSTGLFSVVLDASVTREQLGRFCDGLSLFGLGHSWGAFESLLIPVNPGKSRGAEGWPYAGPTLRVHAGLEDAEDLIEDLGAAFTRM